jgi:serine/threonine-protein kinase
MSSPGNSPRRTGVRQGADRYRDYRFSFESGEYRYEVEAPLLLHPDFDTLLVASRRHLKKRERRSVVLKKVGAITSREARARATEEVRLAGFLHHPRIARVFDFVVHEGTPFVVMEHAKGSFLFTLLDLAAAVDYRLPTPFAVHVAAEVADALAYAHECEDDMGTPLHIIHRAVGPMRIRLTLDGRVKLTNFGAAYSELAGRMPTPRDLLRGDPAYIAPELLRAIFAASQRKSDPLAPKELDGRADVFSLGLVLLEMLTAKYPLDPLGLLPERPATRFPPGIRTERPTWIGLDVLANRVLRFGTEEVTRATGFVPEPLRAILIRALAADPGQRYQTAELRDDLRGYLREVAGSSYGRQQVMAEVQAVVRMATERKKLAAQPMEFGVLPDLEDLRAEENGG